MHPLLPALIGSVMLALLAAGCSQPGDPLRGPGSYPVELFQEMHYQQTYKAQEPPRIGPPEDSVPVQGSAVVLPDDVRTLVNPVARTPQTLRAAAWLYQINCAACHGPAAGGDGKAGEHLVEHGSTAPPAFDSDRVRRLSPGETFASISNGFGIVPNSGGLTRMPAFGKLLSDEDRWAIVHLIRLSAEERRALLTQITPPGHTNPAALQAAAP